MMRNRRKKKRKPVALSQKTVTSKKKMIKPTIMKKLRTVTCTNFGTGPKIKTKS